MKFVIVPESDRLDFIPSLFSRADKSLCLYLTLFFERACLSFAEKSSEYSSGFWEYLKSDDREGVGYIRPIISGIYTVSTPHVTEKLSADDFGLYCTVMACDSLILGISKEDGFLPEAEISYQLMDLRQSLIEEAYSRNSAAQFFELLD